MNLPARLPALDGVRGLAILLVLCHNLLLIDSRPPGLFARGIEFALNLGWVGVQLFFVLSGFLITGILLDTQEAPNYYRSFFGRRVLRIFPLYYATLLFFMLVLPALVNLPPVFERDRARQLSLWLYVSNWTEPYGLGGTSLPHFWSLAVEEQFYLLWPLFVRRRTPHELLRLCLWVAALGLGARLVMVWAGVISDAIYTFSTSRMDALGLGAAAAALVRMPGWLSRLIAWRRGLWTAAWTVAVLGLVLTHGYPRALPRGQALGYSILAVVFGLAVLAAACGDAAASPSRGWLGLLRCAPMRTLGKYSYGMYVLHKPLHDLVGNPVLHALGVPRNPGVALALGYVAAGTLVTLAAAVVSYHLLEKHFLAFKRHVAAERVPSASVVAGVGGGSKAT